MTIQSTSLTRGRGASSRIRALRPFLVFAGMLLCAAGVWAAAAPQVVGPADDPYVVDPVNGLIPSAPLVFEKADALTNPVASINIGAVDPSLFPHICTYVDALDAGGVPVGHLPADSFCVYQDGTRLNTFSIQELTFDSCRTATCLVIDVSGSMKDGGKMAAAKNAAKRYVRRMNIYDRTALVKFSDCYTVVQNFTSDTSALINAINSLTAGGRTAYFDGVWRGVGLTTTELGSKAVIALTDGMENNSQNCGGSGTPNGLGDGFANDSTLIVNLANGAGIPIYNVTLGNSFDPQYAIKLSNATGGAHYHAPTNAQLDSIYDAIKFRLCSRYLICYNSPDTVQNGDCHNVIICHKSGNGSCSPCDTGSYCEKAPPVIKRTVATIALDNTCQRWGKTVQLCAYVTDKDTPLNQLTVNLFYRNSNASPYTSVATSRTDSTFCASVPGSQLACGGDSIQYYFTASDGERTVASPTNAPTGHYAFPICPNHAPVCNVPRDTTIAQCAVAQVCLPVTATDQDNNFQSCAKTVGPGTLSGNQWCYTPSGTGTVSVTVRCTDSCGLFCEKTFNVTFSLNSSPVCNVPRDTTIFQCSPAQVCLPTGATDSDGNLTGCSITSGPGTLSGGNWCYTPTGEQSVTVSIRCTDACGAVCEKTFHVTFDINDAPVCGVPRDTTIFQCAPTQVCLPVSATDANGNSTGCSITSGPGTLSGGNWCYTPTGDQTVDVTIRCSDACGAFCEKTFHVTFDINDAPVCNLPRDTTIFQCAPAQVCLPTSATDVNGNLTGCSITSGPGALTSGNWCYTPTGDQTVDVTIRCDDACGAFCEKTFHVTFDVNDAPVCSVPRDTTILQCAPAQVCLPVSATDANGNFSGCSITSGPGTLSGGNWCYTPAGDEAVTVTIRCSDACGAFCEKTFHVTFDINDAPVCDVPRDTSFFQCAPTQVCLPVSATDADNNLSGCSVVSGPGSVSGGNWCYTPTGDQTVTVTVRCADACGAFCEKTFHVTFDINDAPVCSIPTDTSFFQCAPTQVCLPVSATDANGNPTGCSITSGPGTLSGGNWCYTPSDDQTVTVTIRCTDACGAFCEKTFHATFDINDAPVCNVPRDTTIFQCAPAQVCLPVSATDANGNLTGCAIVGGPGTLGGGNWCYTPAGDEAATVTVRCTDACGAFCEKSFHVTFDINDAPVCNVPHDTTVFQCTPTQVCLPVSATDADGNLTGCSIVGGPGTLSGGNWCYTPTGDETATVTIRCTDGCGAFCEKTFQVTFDINDPPSISLGDDVSVPQSFPQAPICFTYTVSDPNGLAGLLESLVSSPGGTTIDTLANQICFTPSGTGTFTIIAQVIDPCGASDRDTILVFVSATAPPNCNLPNDTTVLQCSPAQLCLPVTSTSLNPPVNCVILSGPGSLSGGQWCYTPAGDEVDVVTIRCTDALGATCSGSFTVTFDINDPPVCNVPRDTAIFQCTPAQVCLPTGATDPNGNLTGCSIISGPGTLSGGNWCYTPTGDQTVAVTVRCTDACGASCEKTFHVTFDINEAPVCSVPNDTTIFQCTPTPVCMPVSATDADGNLSGCALVNGSPGNLNGNWCYTPSGDQTVAVAIRCIDDCGAFCEKTFHVTFDVNDAPVCNLPRDTTIFQCAPAQICMPVSATDVNGNLVGCAIVNGSGTLSGGNWCYTPAGSGSVDVTIRCTDACGATCEGTFRVTFVIGQPPQITCPPDLDLACASQAPACNPNDVIVTGGTGTVTVVCNRTDNGGSGCAGSPLIYEYTYTATDSCGLTAHCKRTVTVIDNVRPHLAGCPSDVIIQCSSPVPPAANVTATDNCDQNVAIAFLETTNLHGCGGYTGTITRRWIATDHCGNADTCIQVITKVDTQAPVCSLPSGTVNFFQCTPTQISVPVSATDNCDQSVTCQVVSGLGSVYNGQWTYYPTGNASFGVTIRCSDDCGNICEGTFQVSIQINGPPTIAFGADQSIFQCSPAPICVAYSVSDPNSLNGSTESLVSGPLGASIDPANNRVCFTPSGPGTFTVIARVTDSCGSSDVDTINVNVTQNAPPTVAFGNDLTVRQCLPGPICVNYSVSDPNGIGGLSESLVSGPAGAVINTGADQVCFTPPGSGTFPIIVRVTDSCGASDQDTIVVAVIQNSAPVCSVPRDTTIFQCAPAPVCLPVSATDPDGGAVTCQKTNGPGQLSNGNWCYAPSGSQTVLVTIRCSDTCGAYCERSFSVTFTVNSPPTCSVPPDQTFHQNCVPQEVQLPVVGSDVDGNLTSCQIVSGPGHLVGSMWLYTPTDNGQVCVTIRCTDGCGATCERSFCVLFLIDKDNCGCRIEASLGDDDGTIETLNGRQVSLPVNIDSLSAEIGGFDLLICYDPSVLVFLKADIGPALDTLKWEYFTYRAGPRGNCTGGCPSGYIRLVGIANMNNMVTPPPTAYRPLGKIASLIFEVAPDRNLIGQCIPINFCWLDCGDNTFSSRSGDTTFVEQHMIIDTCQSNAKTNPIPGICFSGGWICIIEPPDDRGDINLNNIANEVGDAVLFTNYFIYGPSVWSPPYDLGQILATDVNDDGVVLTVADLIFLIRIITGDAQPYPPGGNPRLAPEARTAQVRSTVENGVLRVTSDSPVDVGGAFLTFRYSDVGPGEPVLSADAASLSIKSHAAHGELRVIAYLWERGTRLAAGAHELLGIPFTGQGQIELASVEMSDADGNVLPVRMAGGFVPKDYALLQNYPNPFNAGTVISFDLVDEADWSLSIYNILGQEVRNFTGHQTVGRVQLPWDGADRSGDAASSGIYFYRLRAGSFSATKKMLLVR